MSTDNCISRRAVGYLPEAPKFFDVLNDLWHPESNPNGILNLGLAENPSASPHALTYGDGFTGSKQLKKAWCQLLNKYSNSSIPIIPSHLHVTPGVGNALECCAWSLFDQEDQVLVGRPYWTAFNYIFGIRAGVRVREVSFRGTDPFSLEAVQEYEREYLQAQKEARCVKAILLCSPHNPLGRCYPQDVLRAYMSLCGRFGLHLIVDEIYALSVFENAKMQNAVPFTSILSLQANGLMDPRKVHVQWGLSKDFGATGLRIGCLISQSNELFLKSLEGFSLLNFPSSLADNAVSSLLSNEEYSHKYITTYQSRLAESYKHVTGFLDEHGIAYRESNASLFLMVTLSFVGDRQFSNDDNILALLRRKKLYLTSAMAYRSEEPGWFRIVIAHPKSVLDEGLKRLLEALSESS
ncbi:aspartate aminotransferase [Fusarium circinatum]|uniref:Aspartate aminotransferase n=1 Tax=Fusarium circinatum TaxID=48490 RepID=A0A8H5TYI5_FUSCI|nr:aspartate aminotransferase [Fusarium circinatum]